LYVLSIVLWYYTHLSIICVNLWFWHTYEMHLVFFGNQVWRSGIRAMLTVGRSLR
jgi:hypothetical protein